MKFFNEKAKLNNSKSFTVEKNKAQTYNLSNKRFSSTDFLNKIKATRRTKYFLKILQYFLIFKLNCVFVLFNTHTFFIYFLFIFCKFKNKTEKILHIVEIK